MELSFYSFFNKFSVLDKYGLVSGLWARLWRKVIPRIPPEGSFEFFLKGQFKQKDWKGRALERIEYLLSFPRQAKRISTELDRSIVSLTSRILAIGLDHEITHLFDLLEIDRSCLDALAIEKASFSSQLTSAEDLNDKLDAVLEAVELFRAKKGQVGTSLHLTVLTQELVTVINRCKALLHLRSDLKNLDTWETLLDQYKMYDKSRNSLRTYFNMHADLLALEIVEHTSSKGEGYVAESAAEYNKFFLKGIIGGAIIAVFALGKIYLSKYLDGEIVSAFMYSINYAACFVLVKFVGGTIATKQPAMTASTITKYIDKDNDLVIDDIPSVVTLLRRVSRSQFISLIGNFVTALTLAMIIGAIMKYGLNSYPISDQKANYLIDSVLPFASGAAAFAAIAGVFLATSGFVSGYFDNKMIASKLPYRILHHPLLKKITTQKFRVALGAFTIKNMGTIAGNVSLGFMLGMAWLLSYVLPFPVDIRHIAFSSSNVGYAIITDLFSWQHILLAIVYVLLIGTINFFVSFSITLYLALKSRRMTLRVLPQIMVASLTDFVRQPLSYFIYRNETKEQITQAES